ncbi:head GIN domain-containing protein [Lunatimonas salinarum]|uniref:head GIN domain-containing protein n=1 Tax=Lunatimonas salinarum TaxID=1774590 RepID=UPI001ADF84CA|nr:head GIN domain-containing protein [Lunatimonas salinarum]
MNSRILMVLFMGFFLPQMLMAQTNNETRPLPAFNGVSVSNGIEAVFVKGEKHGIEITASGLELSRVETSVTNRVLEMKIAGVTPRSATVKATITYVDLENVQAATSAKVFIKDPLAVRSVQLSAATSSYIEAVIQAQGLVLEAQTNSKIFVKGKASDLNFSAATNAEIDAEGLEVAHAEVKINTNAKGSFMVTESLKGTAATRGRITYTGDPKILDVKTNTGGAIDEK